MTTIATPPDALTILDHLPDGFLQASARDLHRLFDGPTLIELPGEREAPLFVSILLHGNEDSGLGAMQHVLAKYQGRPLPRSLMLLIGNVAAAREGLRRLDSQPDFNRVWPGAEPALAEVPEARLMAAVHQRVVQRGAFAAIDLHNNTGRNPHYAVLTHREPQVLALAALFARRAVLFLGLPGTQTASFDGMVPAITAECGQPGEPVNAEAAARLVEAVLALENLPQAAPEEGVLELFHTIGVVHVRPNVAFGFGDENCALNLSPVLDRLNFTMVEAGTAFGTTTLPQPLEVIDEAGRDIAGELFSVEDGVLHLTRRALPAMLTVDPRIVQQDCLCYLMEWI